MTSFKALFSPFRIGNLELKNRIVMPPMATHFAGEDGTVNDRHIAYYVRRAQGGVGYITTEHTGISRQGRAFPQMALIDSDEKIPPFQRSWWRPSIGKGANLSFRSTTPAAIPLLPPRVLLWLPPRPSPVPFGKEMPRELSQEEIRKIVDRLSAGGPSGPRRPGRMVSRSIWPTGICSTSSSLPFRTRGRMSMGGLRSDG